MTVRRVVPNLTSTDPGADTAFFADVTGLEAAMDLGWVRTLVSPGEPTAQVSLLTHDATAPLVPDLSIEVADVDAAFVAAVERGDQIVYPLTHEDWGVRRFFVRAPSGQVVNVVSHD